MLVLARKLGEQVVIGENITVTVVDISQGKVRLGFEHPRDMTVHRKELHDALSKVGNVAGSDSAPNTGVEAFMQHVASSLHAKARDMIGKEALVEKIMEAVKKAIEQAVNETINTTYADQTPSEPK